MTGEEVRDHTGRPVLVLTRPAKVLKSRILVQRPGNQPVGEIIQDNVFGKHSSATVRSGARLGNLRCLGNLTGLPMDTAVFLPAWARPGLLVAFKD